MGAIVDHRAGVNGSGRTGGMPAQELPAWLVQRPRVERLIGDAARRTVTVVTGPAGSGKTTAVGAWRSQQGQDSICWLSADEYDNAPDTFWGRVRETLRSTGAQPPSGDVHNLATALAASATPTTLVIDDLHRVTEPDVYSGLAHLLANSGRALRLIICSRAEPQLPMHRYRLAGELSEVGGDQLAFTVREARDMLAALGLALTPEQSASLVEWTEGWAGGLRLAAMSMDGRPDRLPTEEELTGAGSQIADYLLHEVFERQSPVAQHLLLRASALGEFDPEMASAITGISVAGAARQLATLARAGVFVRPVAGGRLRLHRLFAGVLVHKLRTEHPEQLTEVHRAVVPVLCERGSVVAAAEHAVRAGDWPMAADVVVREHAAGDLVREPDGRLANLFRRLPERFADATPQTLVVTAALALGDRCPERCADLLSQAGRLLDRPGGRSAVGTRLEAELVRFEQARDEGDLTQATSAVRTATSCADALPLDLAGHQRLRAVLPAARAVVGLWSGEFDHARRDLAACLESVSEPEHSRPILDAYGWAALLEAFDGRFNRADQLLRRLTESDHGTVAATRFPVVEIARCHIELERNAIEPVRLGLKRAKGMLRSAPDRLLEAIACLVSARLALADGRTAAVAHLAQHALAGWHAPAWLVRRLYLLEAHALAVAGDTTAAAERAMSAGDMNDLDVAVAVARSLVCAGDTRQAHVVLDGGVGAVAVLPADRQVEAWLVDARVHDARGEWGRARRTLGRAIRLARREDLRLPLSMEWPWLGPLLARSPELTAGYRMLVTSRSAALSPGTAEPPEVGHVPIVVEPLSEREREVLTHVSGMLTTQEVAMEMFVSVNTVKTHVRNIFRKLEASNRGEAVRRARQLGLL